MVDFSVLLDPHVGIHYLHYFGVVIALGSVFATDALNSYLHLRPSVAEYDAEVAPILSSMIWAGFLILSITGSLLLVQHPSIVQDTVFQLKMFFIAIIFLNGVFLNVWVTPKFQELSVNWSENNTRDFEIIAGLSAAVSVIGWLTVFTLGFIIANA